MLLAREPLALLLVERTRCPKTGSDAWLQLAVFHEDSLFPMMQWEGCVQPLDLGLLGLLNCEINFPLKIT